MNDCVPDSGGRYVLCWLQQALRARDNPVIDASVRLGNALNLPVLVYHGVREDYPYASDRLHRFILGASVDLGIGCRERGLACVRHVDRDEHQEKGLVYRLAAEAAAVVLEDQPTFVARWQAERVATRAQVPILAVNTACLVPPALIGDEVRGRPGFLRRHEPERAAWSEWHDEQVDMAPYAGKLPFTPDRLEELDVDALVATLAIDHSLPISTMHSPGRVAAEERLARLVADVLPSYASARNDATRSGGASGLSPYLHFGVLGPREIMAAVNNASAGGQHKRKFADELLGFREWFHYQARQLEAPERYDRVAGWARQTLADHASDARPEQETLCDRQLAGDAGAALGVTCSYCRAFAFYDGLGLLGHALDDAVDRLLLVGLDRLDVRPVAEQCHRPTSLIDLIMEERKSRTTCMSRAE